MARKIDQFINTLRDLIYTLQPNQRFFSIRELRRKYQVSQMLIYKALDCLKADGLLVSKLGGELFVAENIDLLTDLRQPAILVAIPRWKSPDVEEIKQVVQNTDDFCPGYRLLLMEYDAMSALPRQLPLVRDRIAGAVLFASGSPLTPDDLVQLAAFQRQIPITVVNQHLEDFGIPSVGVDDALAANLAMHHLLQAGHRQIGILYCEPHSRVMELRCRSALDYAHLQGVEAEIIDCGVEVGELAVAKTFTALRERVSAGNFHYTALLGLSGEPSLGAIAALEQVGQAVSGKISFVTIAHEKVTASHKPPIDTISVMLERQIRAAIQTVTLGASTTVRKIIRPELLIYGSVRPVCNKGKTHVKALPIHSG